MATEVVAAGIRVLHTYSGAEGVLEPDTVVMVFGGKAEDGLYHELEAECPTRSS